jgi:hypothetical protein
MATIQRFNCISKLHAISAAIYATVAIQLYMKSFLKMLVGCSCKPV